MTVGQYEMASMAKSRRQIVSDKLVLYGALLLISLFAFFPIYWMLVTSLTPAKEVFAFPPRLFPSSLTLD